MPETGGCTSVSSPFFSWPLYLGLLFINFTSHSLRNVPLDRPRFEHPVVERHSHPFEIPCL
ncbi:unnamed protein product [Choristocarpus tenellus]